MKKRIRIEQSICHLGLHYFFVGIIKQLLHVPIRSIILVLWNMKFNYYKEQSLELAMVKHKLEGGTSRVQVLLEPSVWNDLKLRIQLWKFNLHCWIKSIFQHACTLQCGQLWRRITIGWLGQNLMNFTSSLWSKRSFVVSRFLLKEMFCTVRRSWDYHAIR